MARAPKTPAQIRVEFELRALYPGKTLEEAMRMDLQRLRLEIHARHRMECLVILWAGALMATAICFGLASGGL